MILAVDIGGSKSLAGVFDDTASPLKQTKFSTPENYDKFTELLMKKVKTLAPLSKIEALGLGVPCSIDYDTGEILGCGNLPWRAKNLVDDLAGKFKSQIATANDADCAGLYEAKLGAGKNYKRILYVTISTGIGTSLIVNGKLSQDVPGSEGGQMVTQTDHHTFRRLEDLISGPAIIERFGKPAYDINDKNIWQTIAREMAGGLYNMITLIKPEVVILGGGVAVHFEVFHASLDLALRQLDAKLFPLPPVIKAAKVEQAVLLGAYLLAKGSLSK